LERRHYRKPRRFGRGLAGSAYALNKGGQIVAANLTAREEIHSRIDNNVSLALGPDLRVLGSGFGREWASGKVGKRKEFTEMLKKADLTMDDVMAEALAEIIDSFERFDRMLASAEARRNNALREIDRHREALGDAIRRAVDVQDAEYRDIETGEMGGGSSP
jgi:hypothetical protein